MRDPFVSASPCLGSAPVFSVLQHNCLGSWDVFLSLFNSFGSDVPFVVCLQDPPVWRGRLPSADGFVSFVSRLGRPQAPRRFLPPAVHHARCFSFSRFLS